MRTQIQELIACYEILDDVIDIIESENSGLSQEQRLSSILIMIKNFKEE